MSITGGDIWHAWWQDMEYGRYLCKQRPKAEVRQALLQARRIGLQRLPSRDAPAYLAWIDDLNQEVQDDQA